MHFSTCAVQIAVIPVHNAVTFLESSPRTLWAVPDLYAVLCLGTLALLQAASWLVLSNLVGWKGATYLGPLGDRRDVYRDGSEPVA